MRKPEIPMHILQTEDCPSLTGKSTLTYQLGRDEKNVLHLRIHKSTGNGFFNREWVRWDAVEGLLQQPTEDQAFNSLLLFPLFKGKSVNTPAFLLAVLKHEGVVRLEPGKQRQYLLADLEPFLDKAKQLLDDTSTPAKQTTASSKKASTKRRKATP